MLDTQQFQGMAGFLDMDDLFNPGNVHDRTQQVQPVVLGSHQQYAMLREIRPFHQSAPQALKNCAFCF
jgi:hypothetical protein